MTRSAQENIVAVVLLALFAGIIFLCLDFGPRARMIPLPLAVFGLVLTAIQLLWQNLGSPEALQMEMIEVRAPAGDVGAAQPEPKAASGKRPSWRREAGAYAIIAILLGLTLAVGVIPAVFLFTAGYFLVSRHYSWRAGLIYTAVFTASVYLLFEVALQIQPYYGLLAPFVERLK